MTTARPCAVRLIAISVLAMAFVASSTPSALADAGVVLRQRQGPTYLKVTVSASGARTTRGARKRGPNGKALKALNVYDGTSLRYGDGRLYALDFVHHTYSSLLLKAALADSAAESALIAKAVPRFEEASDDDPPADASPADLPTKPQPVRASFGPVVKRMRIASLRAEAHILEVAATTERVWIATTLPRPPSEISRAIRTAFAKTTANPVSRAMREAAGRVVLRVEVRSGKRWRRLLNTTSATRANVADSAFDPPKGWTRTAAQSRVRQLRSALRAARAAATLRSVPALVSRGPGPISGHPEPYIFYWGRDFASHPQFRTAMDSSVNDMLGPEFLGGLGQYGIGNGRLLGSEIIDDNPPRDVGNANFAALGGFVLTHRYGYAAPKVWSTVGGHDPFIIMFVAKNAVDNGGWGGYHFFVPTEAVLVPWPFSLLVHDAMPWMVVKVDQAALDVASDDQQHRRQCRGDGPPVAPAVCSHLGSSPQSAGMDHTTGLAAHELAETVVDPYPFFGWADFGKFPVWAEGEITDICAQGSVAPFGTYSIARNTVVTSYWSNSARACVPEMRPTIAITSPASDGADQRWRSPVTLAAVTSDPIDGNNRPVSWRFDGGPSNTDPAVLRTLSSALSLGSHTITATVFDTQGLSATATRRIVVSAVPPEVTIAAPANGATIGDDETRAYRAVINDAQDGTLPASSITWTLDGAPMGTGAQINYRITAHGAHTVTVRAVNSAGYATERSIVVNIGAPTGNPSVIITAPLDGTVEGATLFHLTATATSPVDGVMAGSTIHWSTTREPGWSPIGGDVIYDARGSCVFGMANYTAAAADSASHTGSDTISLYVGTIC